MGHILTRTQQNEEEKKHVRDHPHDCSVLPFQPIEYRLQSCLRVHDHREASPGFQFHVEAKQNKVARTILTQKQRTYNKARKSEIATRIKKVRTLAEMLLPSATEDNVAELEKLISEATKSVDKAAAKGVLHKNTGARRKSKMAKCKHAVLKANDLMTHN